MSEIERGDCIVADALRAALRASGIEKEIVVVEEATSTNDLAWEAASRGAAEGFAVFAERQTAGRGQYGRRWESAAGKGLWFSVVLRPPITLSESPRLTLLLADAVARTITQEIGCATSSNEFSSNGTVASCAISPAPGRCRFAYAPSQFLRSYREQDRPRQIRPPRSRW